MTDLTIIISVTTLGFAFNFALMRMMWTSFNQRLDKIEERLTDIDRRVCRIEGALASKDCCMLKDEQNKNKAL